MTDAGHPAGPSEYTVAPYAFDGEPLGVGRRQIAQLSEKWIGVCDELLSAHGQIFDAALDGPLQHIRIKCTSAEGTALVWASVKGRVQASYALARGPATLKERGILEMFVESLRRVDRVKAAAKAALPFGEILELDARPLMIVVIWGDGETSQQDNELVMELMAHFAAAYFLRSD